jgi:hypothetical protein
LATAQTLLRGEALSESQRRSRDLFNLKFGAAPLLLPAAQLLVVNPVLRRLYRLVMRVPGLQERVMRLLGSG